MPTMGWGAVRVLLHPLGKMTASIYRPEAPLHYRAVEFATNQVTWLHRPIVMRPRCMLSTGPRLIMERLHALIGTDRLIVIERLLLFIGWIVIN